MKPSEALTLIESDHPHDRLRGARALSYSARPGDAARIQKALAKETVLWVRKSLERALARVGNQTEIGSAVATIEDAAIDDATIRDIFLRASEEMVSTLLHEILPKLGYIRAAAVDEIQGFESSDTKAQIDSLEELLKLLAEFRKVSQAPKLSTFDLGDLIFGVAQDINAAAVTLAGSRPFVVTGEPTRIRLAVTNGLRNALEAISAVGDERDRKVMVNWGSDNERYWISIVDEGIGIHGNISGMFQVGRTSKLDHFGMGLPLAKQAMMALGGDVSLAPGRQGGARFEIQWDKLSVAINGSNPR